MTYRVIRSNRKTISLEVRAGELIVRAPQRLSAAEIDKFVLRHKAWIENTIKKTEEARKAADKLEPLTIDEIKALAEKARELIPQRVAYYAPKIGVTYGRITIRSQRTKWGSCSSKGNLNFNCLLMLAPPEVLDSIVVHELCHRREMNHSRAFYEEVYKVFPEYDKWHRWLKENGEAIMGRMR